MLIETLSPEEARVLGTLLEKSLATPDYYPMTLNALRTACNQKSSREPVTDYDEGTVAGALAGLKRKCLAVFVSYGSSGNAFKYRHFLEDARFDLDAPARAVFAVLLLRGAQTLNEIRTRAASLHPLDPPEAAEAALQRLAGRPEPLAELLPKRPGWKEPRWRDTVRAHAEEAPGGAPEAGTDAPTAKAPVSADRDGLEELKREVAALREAYAALKAEVEAIRSELGG